MKKGPSKTEQRGLIIATAYEKEYEKINFFQNEQGAMTSEGCALVKAMIKAMEIEDEMQSEEEAKSHHKHKHHHHKARKTTPSTEALDNTIQKEKKLGYKRY